MMRPGISQNVSYALGDCLGIYMYMYMCKVMSSAYQYGLREDHDTHVHVYAPLDGKELI